MCHVNGQGRREHGSASAPRSIDSQFAFSAPIIIVMDGCTQLSFIGLLDSISSMVIGLSDT